MSNSMPTANRVNMFNSFQIMGNPNNNNNNNNNNNVVEYQQNRANRGDYSINYENNEYEEKSRYNSMYISGDQKNNQSNRYNSISNTYNQRKN